VGRQRQNPSRRFTEGGSLSGDVRLVGDPQPCAVALPSRDLCCGAAAEPGRGESEIAATQRGAYVTGELRRVSEQRFVHPSDRRGAGDQVASCRGEHGIWFVQRCHAVDVAGIRPLQEEPAEVFGLGGPFTVIEVSHSATSTVVCAVSSSNSRGADTVRQADPQSASGAAAPDLGEWSAYSGLRIWTEVSFVLEGGGLASGHDVVREDVQPECRRTPSQGELFGEEHRLSKSDSLAQRLVMLMPSRLNR